MGALLTLFRKYTTSDDTTFNGVPTNTCVGIGSYIAEEIDKITKKLKLL